MCIYLFIFIEYLFIEYLVTSKKGVYPTEPTCATFQWERTGHGVTTIIRMT